MTFLPEKSTVEGKKNGNSLCKFSINEGVWKAHSVHVGVDLKSNTNKFALYQHHSRARRKAFKQTAQILKWNTIKKFMEN